MPDTETGTETTIRETAGDTGTKREIRKRNRGVLLLLAVILVALLVRGILRVRASVLALTGVPDSLNVIVESDGNVIVKLPLKKNVRYVIRDGTAEKLRQNGITADEAGRKAEADGAQDVNVIEIRDGEAFCAWSNCKNQICVHTAPVTEDAPDTPVVCLPHRLVMSVSGDGAP